MHPLASRSHRLRACTGLLLGALLLAALPPSVDAQSAPRAANGVRQITPKGDDGDTRYFRVLCRDRTLGTIRVRSEGDQVCAEPQGGELVCKADWAIAEAAESLCK